MSLVENFQRAFHKSGKSQAQVARELEAISPSVHLSASGVSGMLAGKRRLYLDQAMALARVFDVSLEELVEGVPSPPRGEVLTEDERYVLRVLRGLGLNADEAVRRLAGKITIKDENAGGPHTPELTQRRRG